MVYCVQVRSMEKYKFAVIGGGRLGSALANALKCRGQEIIAVTHRNDDIAAAVRGADIVALTITDGRIVWAAKELAQAFAQMPAQERPKYAFHVSGASTLAPLMPLKELGIGVGSFHPLQTFTPAAKEDTDIFAGIYCAVAGEGDISLFLQEMADLLGAKTFSVPDDEGSRARYHAAACIACNYLVTLTAMAQEIFSPWMDRPEEGLAAIMPLVKNTVNNLSRADSAIDVLTGPIARGDTDTVDRHRLALSPNMREVYEALCKETIAQMLKRNGKNN